MNIETIEIDPTTGRRELVLTDETGQVLSRRVLPMQSDLESIKDDAAESDEGSV